MCPNYGTNDGDNFGMSGDMLAVEGEGGQGSGLQEARQRCFIPYNVRMMRDVCCWFVWLFVCLFIDTVSQSRSLKLFMLVSTSF